MKNIITALIIFILIIFASCITGSVSVIKDGITEIPDEKFKAKKLSSITIPDSVTKIGKEAFSLNNLISLIIPDGVTEIGVGAFSKNKISNLIISNNIKNISKETFYDNELTNVIIPNGVKEIGDWAFARNKLSNITIPDSVTKIGKSAFAGNNLTSIIIPDSVTIVDDKAFANNPLKSITISNNKIVISENAFGTNIYFNRFFLANNKQTGTYSWQGNYYYFNGEIIPYSAVAAYEQGELEKARQLTETARKQEREIKMKNSFVQVSWTESLSLWNDATNYRAYQGTKIITIDGKPSSNFSYSKRDMEGLIFYEWYQLSPGSHTLEVGYRKEGISVNSYTANGKEFNLNRTTGNGMLILSFEIGKAYLLEAKEVGDKIQFNLKETSLEQVTK